MGSAREELSQTDSSSDCSFDDDSNYSNEELSASDECFDKFHHKDTLYQEFLKKFVSTTNVKSTPKQRESQLLAILNDTEMCDMLFAKQPLLYLFGDIHENKSAWECLMTLRGDTSFLVVECLKIFLSLNRYEDVKKAVSSMPLNLHQNTIEQLFFNFKSLLDDCSTILTFQQKFEQTGELSPAFAPLKASITSGFAEIISMFNISDYFQQSIEASFNESSLKARIMCGLAEITNMFMFDVAGYFPPYIPPIRDEALSAIQGVVLMLLESFNKAQCHFFAELSDHLMNNTNGMPFVYKTPVFLLISELSNPSPTNEHEEKVSVGIGAFFFNKYLVVDVPDVPANAGKNLNTFFFNKNLLAVAEGQSKEGCGIFPLRRS